MAKTFDKELMTSDTHIRECKQIRTPKLEDIRHYFIRLRKEVERCGPLMYPTEESKEKAVLAQARRGCIKKYRSVQFHYCKDGFSGNRSLRGAKGFLRVASSGRGYRGRTTPGGARSWENAGQN